ncbi:MAG: lipoate--protein ligase family protein [Chloroflexi bacterium]|nr:lipoate--protein ligase family protein [Chloroflexota bacterium]
MATAAGARPAWRLLRHFDRPGAWQMAVDEALLTGFVPDRDRPILRLSSWAPVCLSLGYAQPSADIDLAACARSGIDVVRRLTGGRAVLHDQELTYAVIAGADDPLVGGTIGETYRALATGLLAAVWSLGVPAETAAGTLDGDVASRRSGACFAAATRHEVVWQGRKLVGSAQVRRGAIVLQHGSLRLAPARTGLETLLRHADPARLADHLARTAGSVADVVGHSLAPAAAAEAVGAAFAAALGVYLQPDGLTSDETAGADRLWRERYTSAAWTARR